MSWLAAVINRVSNASSVDGKALCPVCSQALTSAKVVKSPKAIGSVLPYPRTARELREFRCRDRRRHRHKAMRQELQDGFGRDVHFTVGIAPISATVVAAPGSVPMVEPHHTGRNRALRIFWHGEPTFTDQKRGGFGRHPYQTAIVDPVPHRAVTSLVLGEHCAQGERLPKGRSPRAGPGGWSDRCCLMGRRR